MKRLPDPTFAEVLETAAAVGLTGETLKKLRENAPYTRWKFCGTDIELIGAQLRTAHVQQPIREIFDAWCSEWTAADKEKHSRLICALKAARDFQFAPIICGLAKEMIDGANRSFAAFSLSRQDPSIEITVLWGRASPPSPG